MTSRAKNLIDLVIFTSACVFLVFCTVWSFVDRQAWLDANGRPQDRSNYHIGGH
jgi:hypothetical protein